MRWVIFLNRAGVDRRRNVLVKSTQGENRVGLPPPINTRTSH